MLALLLAIVWQRGKGPRILILAMLISWLGFSAYRYRVIGAGHREAQSWLAAGTVEVAEGKVEDFNPAPLEKVGPETFRIGTKVFQVTDGDLLNPGLHRTSRRGGPIRSGARLRVTYRGTSILKVENLEP
ncbi:MAG: hypothetical protein JNK60_15355 [Acidobacteria bacterium]|nr:hypothetical protein [Acidobacteriota bacterium]